jgi:glycosyltransferase involved in cell wall biosynthesis
MISFIRERSKSTPKEIDLTNDEHAALLVHTVDETVAHGFTISEIEQAEAQLIRENDNTLVFMLLALKLAKSKLLTQTVTEPLFISVVFAVYKEHHRILNQSEHPHGEDFLLKKVMQLNWLFQDQPLVNWELIVVDDGCPEGSGHIAQKIIDQNELNAQVKVLFLADAIAQKHPAALGLHSTDDSRKGGSIVYGMWEAIQRHDRANQIVVYTDADLSTHLGQLMLLVDPLLNEHKLAAIGSRREPKSVVIKKGLRNNRGKLFIYLWKRLIPILGEIVDTQCGFKAFQAELLPHIIDDLIEKKFAFDIELLLKTERYQKGAIAKVAIAWIDSEAASTTTDLQPYLPMLKAIVTMYKTYLPKDEWADEFARFIESLSADEFDHLLKKLPEGIVNRDPDEFNTYDEVRVSDLAANI